VTEADIERLSGQLERIAVALEILATAVTMPDEEPEPECQHPMETRIPFGSTDGVEDWECGVCRFRTVTS
jgi:hypothetical protein